MSCQVLIIGIIQTRDLIIDRVILLIMQLEFLMFTCSPLPSQTISKLNVLKTNGYGFSLH